MTVLKGYMVHAGTYDKLEDAQADFDEIRKSHQSKELGGFEAAIFEKLPEGKVKVLDTAATSRSFGAKVGAVSGAVLGVLFPAGLILEAASGAALGALTGNATKWMSGHEIKELATMLEEGQAGVVLIGEADFTGNPDALLSRAKSVMQRCFDLDEVALRAAIEEADAMQQ